MRTAARKFGSPIPPLRRPLEAIAALSDLVAPDMPASALDGRSCDVTTEHEAKRSNGADRRDDDERDQRPLNEAQRRRQRGVTVGCPGGRDEHPGEEQAAADDEGPDPR